MRKDQAISLREKIIQENVKIIVCSGGKGGVGKSVVSVNLSLALAHLGKKVLLFDADVGFANDELLLGVSAPRTLKDYLKGKLELEDVLVPTSYGVWLLSGGMDVEDIVTFNIESKHRLIGDFLRIISKMDYVIMDTPAGYHENLHNFFDAADHLISITTPEATSLMNTYTFLKYLVLNGFEPRFHLVVNMVKNIEEGRKTAEKLKQVMKRFLNVDLDGMYIMKYDNEVKKSVILQKPFILSSKKGQPYFAMMKMASELANISLKPRKLPFIERIMKLFGAG